MTPIVQLYWIRVALGIVAGAVTAAIAAWFFGHATRHSTLAEQHNRRITHLLHNLLHLQSNATKSKIEKQSKILSTGIGMYFFTWIAFFVLFYTALSSSLEQSKTFLFFFVFRCFKKLAIVA